MRRCIFVLLGLLAACDSTGPVIPTQIQIVSGNGQSAAVNSAISLVIAASDKAGKPAPGAAVQWTVSAGTIRGDATTDKQGQARAEWQLPPKAGTATGKATIGELTTTFTANAQAGPVTTIKSENDFQTTNAVGPLMSRLSVTLVDNFDNAIADVPVSWRVSAGGGRLVEQDTRTDANGRALATWSTGATLDTQVVVVTAGSLSRQLRALVQASRITLLPASTNLVMGATLRPSISFVDVNNVRLASSTGSLTSSAPGVAEVVNGTIVPRAAGNATITARSGSLTATTTITVGTFPTAARGSAITADSAPASFVAQLRTGGAIFQFPMTGDAFGLAGPVLTEASQVVIDAAAGTRTHFPSVVNVTPASYSSAVINTLMMPRSWRIRGGQYNGQNVDLSMVSAFEPPCSDLSNSNCTGFFPSYWSIDPKVWMPASLPVPVAIHRAASSSPVTAADSVLLWNILNNMNADYGVTLFRPARIEQFTVNSDNTADGAILVFVDQSLVAQNYGGFTNWWWNGRGELYKARVRLARIDLFNASSLVSHEFLHALGHSHTCKWPTVMGGYGCSSVQRLSREDVAYMQLAQRVKTMRVARGATLGMLEAVQGERLMLSETSPFAMPSDFMQIFARARTLSLRGTDGAH